MSIARSQAMERWAPIQLRKPVSSTGTVHSQACKLTLVSGLQLLLRKPPGASFG